MRRSGGIGVIVAAVEMVTVVSAALAVPAVAAPAAAAPVSRQALYAMGSNTFGELGNGTTTASTSPVLVSGLPGTVIQVAAGWETSAALLADGTVWTWGNKYYGGLGYGSTGSTVSTPHQVPGLSGITRIAMSGEGNGYAVAANGSLWAWGGNSYGQLGNGTTTASYSPVQVPGLTGVWNVAAGPYYALALRQDGTVWAWGDNAGGYLGDGTTTSHLTPEQVPGLTSIASVVASGTSFAVTSSGAVFSWGSNTSGNLGTGTTAAYTTSPAPLAGVSGVTQLVSDGLNTLALAEDEGGLVYAWGNNYCGELGDGTTADKSIPEYIGLAGITQVAVGDTFLLDGFSAAVRSDGTLLTWGCNGFGQLGLGANNGPVKTPTPVTALTGVSQIAFGAEMQAPLAGGAYSLVVASAPVVPNLKGDTPAGAHLALQAAGLVVGTISYVIDYSCNNIGRVSGQNPPAGTTVYYGSAVSITIGERPPSPHLCP
jgi:alpha-tubulin suppressor-like RCC1 family protein